MLCTGDTGRGAELDLVDPICIAQPLLLVDAPGNGTRGEPTGAIVLGELARRVATTGEGEEVAFEEHVVQTGIEREQGCGARRVGTSHLRGISSRTEVVEEGIVGITHARSGEEAQALFLPRLTDHGIEAVVLVEYLVVRKGVLPEDIGTGGLRLRALSTLRIGSAVIAADLDERRRVVDLVVVAPIDGIDALERQVVENVDGESDVALDAVGAGEVGRFGNGKRVLEAHVVGTHATDGGVVGEGAVLVIHRKDGRRRHGLRVGARVDVVLGVAVHHVAREVDAACDIGIEAGLARETTEVGIDDRTVLLAHRDGGVVARCPRATLHTEVGIVGRTRTQHGAQPVAVGVAVGGKLGQACLQAGDVALHTACHRRIALHHVGHVGYGGVDRLCKGIDVTLAIEQFLLDGIGDAERIVEVDGGLLVAVAALGGDDDHTVGGLRTIDGGGRSILHDGDALDVVDVETGEVVQATGIVARDAVVEVIAIVGSLDRVDLFADGRCNIAVVDFGGYAVDDVERVGRTRKRSTATDAEANGTTRGAIRLGDVHARHLADQRIIDGDRGKVLYLFALDCRDGAREVLAKRAAVAHDDGLLEALGALAQADSQFVLDVNDLGDIADKADHQLLGTTRQAGDVEAAVLVGHRAHASALDDDCGTRNRLARCLIDNDALGGCRQFEDLYEFASHLHTQALVLEGLVDNLRHRLAGGAGRNLHTLDVGHIVIELVVTRLLLEPGKDACQRFVLRAEADALGSRLCRQHHHAAQQKGKHEDSQTAHAAR